ncbi:MAG TPA: hypothetical protein VKB51_14720 [bacterium]|nr:hypothetical protein [bacterium]
MSTACPADYACDPARLKRPPDLPAETLYVIGGLYGNPEALEALLARQAREERTGGPVTLVFNGDFHWFDVQPGAFRQVGEAVLAHAALRGNVEAELARDGGGMDCGCSYPDYVEPGVAERSNAIFARLAATAAADPAQRARLAGLPLHLVAEVGGRRIAILHGDPESLAGWRLAEEALAALDASDGAAPQAGVPQTPAAQVAQWFRRAGADAFATTHTCLPFARDLLVDGRPRLLINNGSAGMPNFRGLRSGLITRISARPEVPLDSLYGIALGGVRYDALPIAYDHERWLRRFLADWPPGSPAHLSYHGRIVDGPGYTLAQAVRGRVQGAGLLRSA